MTDDEDHILDVTFPEFDRRDFSEDETPSLIFNEGVEWGAGWAFAIIGMAQAIRDREVCASCGVGVYHRTWLPALCPRCYGV